MFPPSIQSAAAVPASCDALLRRVLSVSLLGSPSGQPALPASPPVSPPPWASLLQAFLSLCICWPSLALAPLQSIADCAAPIFIRSSRLPLGSSLHVCISASFSLPSALSPSGSGLPCPLLFLPPLLVHLGHSFSRSSSSPTSLCWLSGHLVHPCPSEHCPPSRSSVCAALSRPPCALPGAHPPLPVILCSSSLLLICPFSSFSLCSPSPSRPHTSLSVRPSSPQHFRSAALPSVGSLPFEFFTLAPSSCHGSFRPWHLSPHPEPCQGYARRHLC